jgi:hypothetical protein
MAWFKLIMEMVLFAVVILLVYNGLRYFLLDKIKVNKWIVFAAAIIILIAPNLLGVKQNNIFWLYGPSGLFIILFLWFVDLSGWNKKRSKGSNTTTTNIYNKKNSKKEVKIRPKAKPNRVKNKKD